MIQILDSQPVHKGRNQTMNRLDLHLNNREKLNNY
uniref:Uncharacterized protein n=1 Tax=Arundo donax TaxID=35708 RepID=A0A0A9H6S3_ARUDO